MEIEIILKFPNVLFYFLMNFVKYFQVIFTFCNSYLCYA